ncbi:MAG: hypothetical protein ACI8RD_003189 [Bacillariaceae sp.]|jgi:hypothetical protein
MVDQCINVKVEKTVEVEETVSQNLYCQPDDAISDSIHCNPTPRTNIWMVDQCVNVKVEKTVGEMVKENLE